MKRMFGLFASLCLITVTACQNFPAKAESLCRPLGYDKAQLLDLREANFEIADTAQREIFALGLLDCLGDTDPDLRDKIGYEGFSTLLRGKSLSTDAVKILRQRLAAMLQDTSPDRAGFSKPFAALALSEVVRVDRVTPIFTDAERRETVAAATDYLRGITDYRGYDENEGWRHGVAHTADVLMQLSLNPAITPEDLTKMRDAIGSQIVPKNAHFYIYGEPGRLVRPLFFMARREGFTAEDWATWFAKIADPAPMESWNEAYSSEAGLAKLHNTKAFANAVYISALNSQNPNINALAEPALDVLKKLP